MSAARVLVLPQVWATASGTVESAVSGRKGPHSLRLVGAPEPVLLANPEITADPGPVGLAFYRKYTEALLRRYIKLSFEGGRVPSLLGRELFRGKVSNYRVSGFDDVVIFVQDVEKCVANLGWAQQHLVRRIAFEEYTQGETAAMLGIHLRTVIRQYADALDKLTWMLLDRRLLEPLRHFEKS